MQRQTHNRAGFSLVELLVASAIFLVLLGGIAALYSNALRTVLFGYQAQGAFEKARASLSVLERDLAGAFSARPYGDRYNFFGTGQGFTFVGRLEDGSLGRVTYAVNPTAETGVFTTAYAETFGSLYNLAWRQGYVYGRSRSGSHGGGLSQASQWTDELLAVVGGQLRAGAVADLQALRTAAATEGQQFFGDALRAAMPLVYDTLIELEIVIQTGALVRYQESVPDLDTFTIRTAGGGEIPWPQVNRANPLLDRFDGTNADNLRLYLGIMQAINPTAIPDTLGSPLGALEAPVLSNLVNSISLDADLRILLEDYRGLTGRVDTGLVENLLRAKRRELWVRMLSGDADLPVFWATFPGDARPLAAAHVICEDIVLRAYSPQLPRIDLLDVLPLFSYTALEKPNPGDWLPTFNHPDNLAGYTVFAREMAIGSVNPADALIALDDAIRDRALQGTKAGSIIDSRLPAHVRLRFWLALEPTFQTNREFRRLFVEEFAVPAAVQRGAETSLMRRERT